MATGIPLSASSWDAGWEAREPGAREEQDVFLCGFPTSSCQVCASTSAAARSRKSGSLVGGLGGAA